MPVLHNYLCKTGIVRAERMGCASHRFAGLLRVSLSFLYESYIPGVSVVDAACMPDNSPHNFCSFSGLHVQIHVDAGCRLNLLFTFRGNETGHVGMGIFPVTSFSVNPSCGRSCVFICGSYRERPLPPRSLAA